MDLYTTYRYLCLLLFWIMYSTEAQTPNSPRWLQKLAHSKRHQRSKRFDFSFKSEVQTPEKYLKDCCQNNGLCVLGSFCQCKKQFYGRYCEFEIRRSTCGPVKHGQWFRSTCSLCRCYKGKSLCIHGAYGQCDSKVFSKKYNPANPKNIVEIFPMDAGENFLENNWLDTATTSSGHMTQHHILPVLLFLAVCIGVV